jgi:hypothetical protein
VTAQPRLRIVVLGMMGRLPFGGHSWVFVNWLRGFQRLGHDVWYVEDDSTWPYDPEQNTVTDDCSYAVRHVAELMERIGLQDRWTFRLADRRGACWGLSECRLDDLYRSCDLLVNLEGGTELREEHLRAPLRLYVETDPVGAELAIASGRQADPFAGHQEIATYGENFGAADCRVPLPDRRFLKTRQAIDLELWPMAFDPTATFFTTIGNYRQEGSDAELDGETYYWSKHVEWEKFIELPRLVAQPFELAMMPAEPDRSHLETHGWRLTDPFRMSLDIFGTYPDYIRRSRAEFTVAKDMNVRLRSGWFSERDACYLASGKPVVAQDTGYGSVYPCGEGLFAFTTCGEALEAIEAINADYERHCRAARTLAEEHFEAAGVASRLLRDLGLA